MDTIDMAQDAQIDLNNSIIDSIIHRNRTQDVQMIQGKKIICKRCKKPILKKRLLALPGTTVCTHCSKMMDMGYTLDDYDPEEEED